MPAPTKKKTKTALVILGFLLIGLGIAVTLFGFGIISIPAILLTLFLTKICLGAGAGLIGFGITSIAVGFFAHENNKQIDVSAKDQNAQSVVEKLKSNLPAKTESEQVKQPEPTRTINRNSKLKQFLCNIADVFLNFLFSTPDPVIDESLSKHLLNPFFTTNTIEMNLENAKPEKEKKLALAKKTVAKLHDKIDKIKRETMREYKNKSSLSFLQSCDIWTWAKKQLNLQSSLSGLSGLFARTKSDNTLCLISNEKFQELVSRNEISSAAVNMISELQDKELLEILYLSCIGRNAVNTIVAAYNIPENASLILKDFYAIIHTITICNIEGMDPNKIADININQILTNLINIIFNLQEGLKSLNDIKTKQLFPLKELAIKKITLVKKLIGDTINELSDFFNISIQQIPVPIESLKIVLIDLKETKTKAVLKLLVGILLIGLGVALSLLVFGFISLPIITLTALMIKICIGAGAGLMVTGIYFTISGSLKTIAINKSCLLLESKIQKELLENQESKILTLPQPGSAPSTIITTQDQKVIPNSQPSNSITNEPQQLSAQAVNLLYHS
jgi:hypothetical protein